MRREDTHRPAVLNNASINLYIVLRVSRRHGASDVVSSSAPAISIIIPTKRKQEVVENLLNSVRRQSFKDFEVIIVSPDRFTNPDPQSKILLEKQGGPARARNLGLREARGELLLFLDDDVELHDEYLARLVTTMKGNPDIAGVGGRSTIKEPMITHPLLPPLLRLFTGRDLSSGEKIGRVLTNGFTAPNFEYSSKPILVEWLRGSNMAFRSQAAERVGFFDENYTGNGIYEDADFSHRFTLQGYKLLLDPSLKQKHRSLGTPLYPEENYAYYLAYNQIYFFYKFKWDGPLALARCLMAQLFQNLLLILGGVVYKKPRAFLSHAKGLIDGFNRLHNLPEQRAERKE
jgi:GT2 family glycosyltransferase